MEMLNGTCHMNETVAILDAGAQYGKVIDRRCRELKVQTEILPLSTRAAALLESDYKGIIISGGPNSVNDIDAPAYDSAIFSSGIPVLGICYGLQLINKHFGGVVSDGQSREDGQYEVEIDTNSTLFSGLSPSQQVLLTHGDSVETCANLFKVIAWSGKRIAGIEHTYQPIFGVQFHPEVDLSENGVLILGNFLYKICGCSGSYSLGNRIATCIEYIQSWVGDSKVLMLLSGGVDSTVCAALLHKALNKEQVIALHINNGFMRKRESENVVNSLEKLGLSINYVDATKQFYQSRTTITLTKSQEAEISETSQKNRSNSLPSSNRDAALIQKKTKTDFLYSTTDPEEKRKIIGDTFMMVANEVLSSMNLSVEAVFLGQGTLRPDLIESASQLASGRADAIKTHHNDTELVRELRHANRVIEPLKDFHKDEVRKIGAELGLPEDIVQRHPFPGPGLAIRVICATEPFIDKQFTRTCSMLNLITNFGQARKKPHALMDVLSSGMSAQEENTLEEITSASSRVYTASLLPIKTVGVQGDCRTYSYVVVISCNCQATCWNHLFFFAKFIPKICQAVNRVVFAFGPTIKYQVADITPTKLSERVLSTIRQCDDIANTVLRASGELGKIAQMPIVLVPIHFDRDPVDGLPSCQHSVALRPFVTSDFMTGLAAVPGKHIKEHVVLEIVDRLHEVPGISRVLYDLTNKPPGTTEWE